MFANMTRKLMRASVGAFLSAVTIPALAGEPVHYRTVAVDDVKMFYREAGPKDAPNMLLLHGCPG